MTTVLERKHKLVNLGDSEYELLGNDGVTLWRIYRYGDIAAGSWRGMVEVQAWGLRRQKTPLGRWEKVIDGFSTRQEAIQAAMRLEHGARGVTVQAGNERAELSLDKRCPRCGYFMVIDQICTHCGHVKQRIEVGQVWAHHGNSHYSVKGLSTAQGRRRIAISRADESLEVWEDYFRENFSPIETVDG